MIKAVLKLHCQHQIPQQLSVAGVILGEDYLLELAVPSGFCKRPPRKMDACSRALYWRQSAPSAAQGSPSCNDLAASIASSHPGQEPSR